MASLSRRSRVDADPRRLTSRLDVSSNVDAQLAADEGRSGALRVWGDATAVPVECVDD